MGGGVAEGERYVLGLDGGGSHTVCLIVEAGGREVGRSEAGPCNHQSIGFEAAREALAQAIEAARRSAGEPPLAAACLGMAGLDRPEDRRVIEKMAAPLLPGVPFEIVHDADIALAAGNGGQLWGVVVLAGTGSIAIGYDGSGRRERAGGWGHLLGDEGSGYDLARQALNAATRTQDGRAPATRLGGQLLSLSGAASLEDLADRIYLERWTVGQVASLAPAVFAAAEAGDRAAERILNGAARQLALAAAVVISRLDFGEAAFPVVLSGGLFARSARLAELVREQVLKIAPRAEVGRPVREPAYGAALLALERAAKEDL